MHVKAEKRNKLKEWHDLWFDEYKRAGYVAVTDFKKQYFYGSNDIERLINATIGKKKQFISINAFDIDWENKVFSRETARLKQIRNIAIDIDQYNIGLTASEALDEIQSLILRNIIPEPNLVLVSRGIQLFYSIDRGASPDISWLVGYITEQLISKLEHIGADGNAKDLSRVMRVPNSVNERNNSTVKPEIWNDAAYTLQELQTYCRPLEQFGSRKKKRNNIVQLPINKRLALFYKTNYARLTDLRRLIELRSGNFTDMRNTFLYMYSFHQSLVLNTQKDVISSVKNTFKQVYSTKDKPMSNNEFERTVKSAYKDAEKFFKHFVDNGYRVVCKANDGIKKPYKTSNVIKKLNITEAEQMQMNTLRNADIARKQHAEYMRSKRRNEGIGSMEEYNKQRKQRKQTIQQIAIELRNKGKTQREIAELTGVSQGYISRILKNITDV